MRDGARADTGGALRVGLADPPCAATSQLPCTVQLPACICSSPRTSAHPDGEPEVLGNLFPPPRHVPYSRRAQRLLSFASIGTIPGCVDITELPEGWG